MKRCSFNHPKIRSLAKRLGLEIWGARGICESLWHVTATLAPRGDIGRYSDDDIADQIGWGGDPARLIAALTDARLLDPDRRHRLVVHDWEAHCDNGVKNKVARSGEGFVSARRSTGPKQRKTQEKGTQGPALAGPGPGQGRARAGLGPGQGQAGLGLGLGLGGGQNVPEALDTPEFQAAWADWHAHRAEKRRPLTAAAIKRQMKILSAVDSDAAVKIIDTAIQSGWTGLYEPRPRQGFAKDESPDQRSERIMAETAKKLEIIKDIAK